MAGLDGQNGAGCGQVGGGHDVSGSTEVGANSNALEDGGGFDEGLDVGDAEVVDAFGDRGGTGLGESGG